MQEQTLSAVLDCLLNEKSTDTLSAFAQKVSGAMCAGERHADRLEPIFTRINGYHPGWTMPQVALDQGVQMPQKGTAGFGKTNELLRKMKKELEAVVPDEAHINELLAVLEKYGSAIPAGAADLSLYDQRKMAAMLASCISEYLLDHADTEVTDADFPQKKSMLLYTADFSGIQKFIYTVPSSGALKALRSRSFFLELVMEHYIDELLILCGVNRVNLLYSGGGHCYILLPNTQAVVQALKEWNERFNEWLTEHFGIQLFLADGWCSCSIDDLNNIPAEKAPYKAIFRQASAAVARKKVHRYTAKQLLRMNAQAEENTGYECRTCGAQNGLVLNGKGEYVCRWCHIFETVSKHIVASDVFLVNMTDREEGFKMPSHNGMVSFLFREKEMLSYAAANPLYVRAYTKNTVIPGIPNAIRMSVGDYSVDRLLEEFAQEAQGVNRVAVCRMDVDNLGQAFVSGFEQADAADLHARYRYVTLARTSAFSRQISLFFKNYVNDILSGAYQNQKALAVTIVYSGGDDVFLVGSWDDVIEAALRIRNTFRTYCCGALSLSAGISLFDHTYPIRLASSNAAAQEDAAKDRPGKNSVSLFEVDAAHIYTWEELEENVLGEKLKALTDFFYSEEAQRGSSFLYGLLSLLKGAQTEGAKSISLARLAYMLSRMEPTKKTPEHDLYEHFTEQIYTWALNAKDRRELITAIMMFSYYSRKAGGSNGVSE